MKDYPKNQHHGLSLLELIITLTIICILLLITVPSFSRYRAQLEYQNLYYVIQQQIQIARSQALISNQDVVICSSQDLIHCQNKQWSTGLLIYIDVNKDRQLNQDEIVISRLDTAMKFGRLDWYGGRFRYCSFKDSKLNLDLQLSQMGHLRSSPVEICE